MATPGERNPTPNPCSLGLQLVLCVQGSPRCNFWPQRGLQAGDQLLLSRPRHRRVVRQPWRGHPTGISTPPSPKCKPASTSGAAADRPGTKTPWAAAAPPTSPALICWATSVKCSATQPKIESGCRSAGRQSHSALPGALALLAAGHVACAVTAALVTAGSPASGRQPARALPIEQKADNKRHRALELLIDPKPAELLISVTPTFAAALLKQPDHVWHAIGRVSQLPMN